MNHSHTDISRNEGCTLTGVLSVTCFLQDAVTVIHGPTGCTHHNASLLHASLAENDCFDIPLLVSSNVSEEEVIFGGEGALMQAIRSAESYNPSLICVVSTCIAETIGDDTAAVCRESRGVPVVHIPGSGFLGGGFSDGIQNALMSLMDLSSPDLHSTEEGVMIVGEKNLEYEAEENYAEVARLLSLLDIDSGLRFVRRMPAGDCSRISSARYAILRDPSLDPIGSALSSRFGTEIISGFPLGLEGSLRFLRQAGDMAGIDALPAIRDEEGMQDDLVATFSDLAGISVSINTSMADPGVLQVARTVMDSLGMVEEDPGIPLPLPFDPPVGTTGVRRMLQSWRRGISRA
nr:nitrogenase component 1 [Methanocalculus chunghsingensis]